MPVPWAIRWFELPVGPDAANNRIGRVAVRGCSVGLEAWAVSHSLSLSSIDLPADTGAHTCAYAYMCTSGILADRNVSGWGSGWNT